MQTIRSLLKAFILPALLAAGGSTSMGASIIDQNFDDTSVFPVNTPLSAAVGSTANSGARWAANDGAPNLPTPVADPVPSSAGDQAIRVRRNGGGVTGLLGYRGVDTAFSSGIVSAQYSIYREAADSAFIVNVENVVNMQNVFPLGIYITTTGEISNMGSDLSGYVGRGVNVPQSTWTKIELLVDLDNNTYDLLATIGANPTTMVLDNYPFNAVLGDLNAFAFLPQGSVGNTFLVDNVSLTSPPVPEPASVGAIMIAGATAVVRRRRA